MTDWQTLNTYFLGRIHHPRYGDYAREMYKLLLILREAPELADAELQADYLYLIITLPDMDGSITVHNEQPGYFTVSLCDRHSIEDEDDVPREFVLPLVRYFLERITENACST